MSRSTLIKTHLVLFIVVASLQNTIAQKVNHFSVKQAVLFAMNNAVDIKNALLDIKIQKHYLLA